MDFLCYCHGYVSRYGGLHMVRLDYCILDHILPTGKPTNLTPVRLNNFEKKPHCGPDWLKIAISQDSFESLYYFEYTILEIKPCGLVSRIRDVEAF